MEDDIEKQVKRTSHFIIADCFLDGILASAGIGAVLIKVVTGFFGFAVLFISLRLLARAFKDLCFWSNPDSLKRLKDHIDNSP